MSTEKSIRANKLKVTELFGVNLFNERVMQQRLPRKVYQQLRETINMGKALNPEIAEIVAYAMKDWAIEKGASHFTHWFQPLNGITAEKHDSFISPSSEGRIIMEFSGKELIQGEPDASSFPSGGIRSTFEARGYTAWDATSPAFLKEDNSGVTLFIPTAFYSYTGDALDKKTPLLRSIEAINTAALRILRLFGNETVQRVLPSVGPEQEYFLIDKKFYDARLDLQLTGRTLFGARPPKGHELKDHYFGTIHERVSVFMHELDRELWKLGISAKTKHNEVAPNQFELATIYTNCNVATDQNQLVMDTMRKLARHHGLVCLLHPKPFAGLNGSGKHNNWSLTTDDGQNLLEPGQTPDENAQFLLFLTAVISAIDKHADLLRIAASDASNDLRLGGHEAPPAIISIYLGDLLTEILEKIEKGEKRGTKQNGNMRIGVSTLPPLPMDSTDRNRTSPFAFTGNKFEFRMVASSASLARPNMILNTIIANTLNEFADSLEKSEDLHSDVQELIKEKYKIHKRVVFNGDGYSAEWPEEAKRRGLPNFSTAIDAYQHLLDKKNVALFEKEKVLSRKELAARASIFTEMYIKQMIIEANTMLLMGRRHIFPAAVKSQQRLLRTLELDKLLGRNQVQILKALEEFDILIASFRLCLSNLSDLMNRLEESIETEDLKARCVDTKLKTLMEELRIYGDKLESICAAEDWDLPNYAEMLFFL
ncbi:MAG TPA: glutamine synthetase type III [Candidatus Marinimicrobia bacterium]|nr:glutamine synthetase type III [Candidatus Neomarinimicrobiota bacterium]